MTRGSAAAAAAKSLQSCPTLCDPIDGSPPGSSVPGILQASTLEWVTISFSNAWQWKVKVKFLSCTRPLATPWSAAHQAPPSMGFSRQEYWSGCHCLFQEEVLVFPSFQVFAWASLTNLNLQLPLPTKGSPSLWSGVHRVIEVLAPSVEVSWKLHLSTILQL